MTQNKRLIGNSSAASKRTGNKNPTQNQNPPRGRVKPLARLLRCATALRVTAPAKKLGARAAQPLDALRAAIVRADEAQTAQTATTDHLVATDAWDALAHHATTQASDCRRGAALVDRTRRRWATPRSLTIRAGRLASSAGGSLASGLLLEPPSPRPE